MNEPAPQVEVPSIEDRERMLIRSVVSLAKFLRDERDRLAERLREVESELDNLAFRFESPRGIRQGAPEALRHVRRFPR